jgi:hypothetical protein
LEQEVINPIIIVNIKKAVLKLYLMIFDRSI